MWRKSARKVIEGRRKKCVYLKKKERDRRNMDTTFQWISYIIYLNKICIYFVTNFTLHSCVTCWQINKTARISFLLHHWITLAKKKKINLFVFIIRLNTKPLSHLCSLMILIKKKEESFFSIMRWSNTVDRDPIQ